MDELSDFCKTLTRDLMKDYEKRFADRMRSVREASTGLNNAGARLGLGVKNAWGTMDKQASEYGMRLVQTIQENAQSLTEKKASSNFHDAGIFHQECCQSIERYHHYRSTVCAETAQVAKTRDDYSQQFVDEAREGGHGVGNGP